MKHKKIEVTKVFGNKRLASLPYDIPVKPQDLDAFLNSTEPPTECYPHLDDLDPAAHLPAESFPHQE